MPLIQFERVSLAYGHHPLLEEADFNMDHGERVCLIGRNGAGKSTLMKLVAGELNADEGTLWRESGLRIGTLAQEVPEGDERHVFEVVTQGLGHIADLLQQYHDVALRLEREQSTALLNQLTGLQQKLESDDGWRIQQRVESVMTRLELPADKRMSELSGGWKRRVLLAQALVVEPDLLLLDEPTNHLDIDSIKWLEGFLGAQKVALLFITHDRTFLSALATRIVELDRGKLTSWPGNYQNYLRRKEEREHAEQVQERKQDKLLAQEEVWVRKGIKARRTRDQGRVRRLIELREARAQRRERAGRVDMAVDRGEGSGKIVFEARDLSYRAGGLTIIDNLTLKVVRGDRIGLVGPNGSGKTTLIRLLLKTLSPSTGEVIQGSNLQVAYFDQQRDQLDLDKTVLENLGDGKEFVDVQGRSLHVISYLRQFLFDSARIHTQVSALSGGERNRLLLAKLFQKTANLLILDEPTNDLDADTLDVLENLLLEYDGTLLIVSHDRAFLDNTVTSVLAFEGEGRVEEHVGGYSDYEAFMRTRPQKIVKDTDRGGLVKNKDEPLRTKQESNKKLSYKEKRELEALPATIEALETEHGELVSLSGSADFYKKPADEVKKVLARISEVETELEVAFERWSVLEERGG